MSDKKLKTSFTDEIIMEIASESYREIVIDSKNMLTHFLMDILELGDNIRSKNDLKTEKSYKILMSLLGELLPLTIVVEERYVDRTYRDSYYMHFSCKLKEYSRFCKRLFIFKGDAFSNNADLEFADLEVAKLQEQFVGTIVIRPLMQGKIGRSLINPYFVLDKKNTYLRCAKYSATIGGMRFYVNAFPFSMQDGETTTCAEVTILNMMDYFGAKYAEYKGILPSDITKIVEENDFERTLPSRGLSYSTITKIFSEEGFYPRLYARNVFADMSQFKRVMHYYIESGIPVALGTKVDEKTRHSIICIGHGKINYDAIGKKLYAVYGSSPDNYIWLVDSSDLCNTYVVMDDGHPPYEASEWHTEISSEIPQKTNKCTIGSYEPEMLMVPLYKRMFMEAQAAYDICTSTLASSGIGIQRFDRKLGTGNNPVIIRLFMCSSKNFKRQRIKNFDFRNREIRERYSILRMPRFVWVCEIYDAFGYRDGLVRGEIVIDATASPEEGTKECSAIPLPILYPNMSAQYQEFGKLFDENEEFEGLQDWVPFKSYDHNLFYPEKLYKMEE